ncbi:hypothetical protein GQ472_00340 [archaeon]|nr:hypothetical protein [archaeon]
MSIRKGQMQIGSILALVIFISAIVLTFMVVQSELMPKKPFESSLKAEAKNIYEKIEGSLSVTIYKTPVFVDNPVNVSDTLIMINFTPSQEIDINSISITYVDGSPIPSEFDNGTNTLRWYSDLTNTTGTNPPNTFYLTYLKGTDLSKYVYKGLDVINGTTDKYISTDNMILYFDTGGIKELSYIYHPDLSAPQEKELTGTGITLSTAGPFNFTNGSLEGKAIYGNTTVRVVVNSTKFFIDTNETVTFDLKNFNNFYIESNNDPVNNITIIDFYNGPLVDPSASGLERKGAIAIIGNLTDYTADIDADTITVNASTFEVYIHKGDYTNALSQYYSYNITPATLLGVTTTITGVFEQNYFDLASKTEDELKEELNISGKSLLIYLKGSE